ncbi:hypothetical protein EH243_03920 [Amphritea opalescens]|uniref:Ankyrin repeat domain-containing protein n=1 Tax=Amphritea opalescens TaxID=2490544 RepID=A0A430KTW4_9GAMM|nr:ankyrin repeat domain-containing protein [Amphritea opalescens]RTE66763.1 hypothetical protein EH243_03920 [Amphritea opalescens]
MLKNALTLLAVIGVLLLIATSIPTSNTLEPSATVDIQPRDEPKKIGLNPYSLPPAEITENPHALLPNGKTALTQAAFDGDAERLNQLYQLSEGHNLSLPDANGDNTLVAAVAGGHHSLASKLMEKGVIVDREAFKRLSKTLDLTDKDEVQWWLWNHLPLADPQTLQALYDPSDSSLMNEILAAGYQPSREEAAVMFNEYLDGDAYFQLYRLYPDMFSPESIDNLFNPVNYDSASPKQRIMMQTLFTTVPYTEDNSWDFLELIEKLPLDLAITHPDHNREQFQHQLQKYCDMADPSGVVLFDLGIKCTFDHPFINAVDADNYALVQHYIDSGIDPKKTRAYGKSPMDIALSYSSAETLEMAKLLIDNGAATQTDINNFYSMMHAFGNEFDHYRPFATIPLKLAVSPKDDLYVLRYSNEKKRYQLSKQDATGTTLWDKTLGEKRFFNILDKPAGLYFNDGKLLLAQNRFIDGRQKTRLTLFNEKGEQLEQVDVLGTFESLIMQSKSYALTTQRTTALYGTALQPIGDITSQPEAFIPAVPLKDVGRRSFHRHFAYDIQKQDYYPDRTLVLFRPKTQYSSSKPERMVSRYLASILSRTGELAKTSLIGGGNLTPLDYAVSDNHAYIILANAVHVGIEKRSADFEIESRHYLTFDDSPFSTTINSMSCDTTGCTLLGNSNNKLALLRTIPGSRQQTLTITDIRYDYSDNDSDDKPGWLVNRDNEQDFISGVEQLRFEQAQPVAKGHAILLDRTLDLVSGANGNIYAIGNHNNDAAYEVLNNKGDLLGHYEMNFGYARSRINKLQPLADGRLLIIGHLYQHFNFFRTYAALLTPQGEPIWSRVYQQMDSMNGLLIDEANHLFYSIDGAHSIAKLSLEDGTIMQQLTTPEGLTQLYRTSQGRIVGFGEKTLNYGSGRQDKTTQPFLYCLAPDETTFSTKMVGEPGDNLLSAEPWEDGLVAAYIKDNEGSVSSNAIFARINAETCQISFDWKL